MSKPSSAYALSPTIEPIQFDSSNNTSCNIPFKSIVSHAMACSIVDPFNNLEETNPFSLFIFGGQVNNKRSNELFECCIEKKRPLSNTTNNTAIGNNSNGGNSGVDDLLLEQKVSNNSLLTVTEFKVCERNNSSSTWPSARSHHQMIYRPPNEDHIDGSLVLFGGQDGQFKALGDLFEFDIHSREWKQIVEPSGQLWPTRRYGHSMVYRSTKDSIVILGGIDTQNRTIFEPFEYSFSENKWKKLELIPKNGSALSLTNSRSIDPSCLRPRANHSAVLYNAQNSRFVQFHSLNNNNSSESSSASASASVSSSGVDSTTGSQDIMIIFGGNNEQDYYNDMFSINLGTLQVNTIMSSHRINAYPRMKHCCVITREEKALILGGNRKAKYDEMKVVSGKTVKSFSMSVLGSVAPKSSIDAPLLNGAVGRGLVSETVFKKKQTDGDNDDDELLKGVDFSDISHHTMCSVSPSCFIVVGGQFNSTVGEKQLITKNDRIWILNLGQHVETIEKLQDNQQKKEFGKEFYQRMLDNLGEYGPIGYDLKINVLNEKTFHVHKFMMSRFDYFKKLISTAAEQQHSTIAGGTTEIPISDASVDTISNIIDYIYGIEPPIFSNPEEVQILNKYCEKHSMNSIVKYTHGKTYLSNVSEYETFLPESQLLLFFSRVYRGEYPELHQYFNSTIKLKVQKQQQQPLVEVDDTTTTTTIDDDEIYYNIKVPIQILVNNDFFNGCLRDLWIKHQLNSSDSDSNGNNRSSGTTGSAAGANNFTIEIDNSIFPFLDSTYIPIIEKYIATLYQSPIEITSSEGESLVSQLIQLYLVSNLLSDTKMESLIMKSCKKRISFENAFQLLCFAYQHQSPNEVVFIYNECIRKLKEVIPLEDVNKIINFLNQEYEKQFE